MHNRGETTGSIAFQFSVSDLNGNVLRDQDFYITILGKQTITLRPFYECRRIFTSTFSDV